MKALLRAGFIAALPVALALGACVSGPPAPARQPEAERPAEKVYEGAGRDASMLQAMNLAKMDAVRKAVVDLIGAGAEQANHEKLQEVLYGTGNPNAYVLRDSFETLRKDKVGEEYLIEARMAVNLRAVESTLRAHGLLGAAGPSGSEAAQAAVAAATQAGSGDSGAEAEAALSPDEKRTIARYVDRMTWMVYFSEEAGEDPFYMKAAVTMANEYLASNGMEAVDYGQVEKLKQDQRLVYEEETGESVSMVQWIAQKLNADVYVEIDGRTSGESSAGKYYGQANITLKGYEASTGRLLGSQAWNSPRTFSTSSEQAARVNALQTSVYKAMPVVIEQARAYMAKALEQGIRYELIVQNSGDPKVMSDFRRKLQRKVRELRTVSQSAGETRYQVLLIGSIEELSDLVYDVAESVPGLEGMYQVILRGKSVTFDAGL